MKTVLEALGVTFIVAMLIFNLHGNRQTTNPSFEIANIKSRFFEVLGSTYSQPSACSATSTTFSSLGLVGPCSILTGVSSGCCGSNVESSFPDLSSLCSTTNQACVTLFYRYWCTIGCVVNSTCLNTNDLSSLITTCGSCGSTKYFPQTNDSFNSWVSDLGLVAGTGSSCISFGALPDESSVPTYVVSVYVNGVKQSGTSISFTTTTATVNTSIIVTSTRPPVQIALTQRLVLADGSTLDLAAFSGSVGSFKAISSGKWQAWFSFLANDTTILTPTLEFRLTSLSNSAGTAASLPYSLSFTSSSTAPAQTNLTVAAPVCSSDGLGRILLGTGVASIGTVQCSCTSSCNIYKGALTVTSLSVLTITNAINFNMTMIWIDILTSISLPSGFTGFYFRSQSRMIVRFAWDIKQAIFFQGDGLVDNHIQFYGVTSFASTLAVTNMLFSPFSTIIFRGRTTFSGRTRLLIQHRNVGMYVNEIFSMFSSYYTLLTPSIDLIQGQILGTSKVYLHQRGSLRIGPLGFMNVPLILQSAAYASSEKFMVTSNAWDSAVVITSAGAANSVTVNSGSVLKIDTSTALPNTIYDSTGAIIYVSGKIDTLAMQSGYLVLSAVNSESFPLSAPTLTWASGSTLGVIPAINWPTTATSVAILRTQGTTCTISTLLPSATVTTTITQCPSDRTCSLTAASESSTYCRIYLTVTAASSSTNTSYTSSSYYSLDLVRSCNWPTANNAFKKAISQFYSGSTVTADQITISSLTCGSRTTTVTFKCSSTSTTAADTLCANIISEASQTGGSLNEALSVAGAPGNDPRGSDSGLFGLFAWFALPLCCVCIGMAYYKTKQKDADNQYLQDTATFSSLAAPEKAQPYAAPAYIPPQQYPGSEPFTPAAGYAGTPGYASPPASYAPAGYTAPVGYTAAPAGYYQ